MTINSVSRRAAAPATISRSTNALLMQRVIATALLLLLAATAMATVNLTPIGNQSVREGETLIIPLNATDTDGDNGTFATVNLPPTFCTLTDAIWTAADPAGAITCNPGELDSGNYSNITVTATDDSGAAEFASDNFNLAVTENSAPVLNNIGNQTVAEGGSLSIPLNATDPDNSVPGTDILSFSISGFPATCGLVDNGNGTGSVNCNPVGGDAGNYDFATVTVTDDAPFPLQDADTFSLTVTANTAPILTPVPDQSVAEGDLLSIPLSATDPDGDNMSFSTTNLPNFCLLNDGNGSGSIDCAPGAATANNYEITVTVTDTGTVPAQSSDSFILSVVANTPPALMPIADQSMTEGESLNIPLSATDADGHNMSFSTTGLPTFCTLTDGNGTGSIDCNPLVSNNGVYPVIVTVTDDGPIPASASDPFLLTVGANQPPTATDVTIIGTPAFGELLTGTYTYTDAEGDLELGTTFLWLRDGVPILTATETTYTVTIDDVETTLTFEVTPGAATGATPGSTESSAGLLISNSAPSITGQVALETPEDTAILLTLADLTVVDADSVYPDDFTLTVLPSPGPVPAYTSVPAADNKSATITPALDFNGPLTVPVTVNDRFADSAVFDLLITVTPVNDPPTFVGVVDRLRQCEELIVQPLCTLEDTSLTIVVDDLDISDPDNVVPDEMTLTLDPNIPVGANYTLAGPAAITPAENFNGQLLVRAVVNDGELDSAPFDIPVEVSSVNDLPVLETPIGSQTFVEDAPVSLDVSANFSDADGEALNYAAEFDPVPPPERNIGFDERTGVFTGPPRFAPADPPDPVYQVTVTAFDPSGETVSDTFDLTISQLGRANLGLSIAVSPESGLPNEELRWTFATNNPVGPVAGENIALSGSFVGEGLSVGILGGANCSISTLGSSADFTCMVGSLPVGQTSSIQLTTTVAQATEVVVFATSEGTEPVPIDPNLADNSDVRAVGVAESFSIGAAQILGNSSVLSVGAGDVNGDGAVDLVVGTVSGQPVQVYIADLPRESCKCQRDFLSTAISIPDTGANEGVALADFDGNGTLDLVVANSGGQADTVWTNDGAGNFTQSATLDPSNGRDVAVGDFDGDGRMDIVVAASSPNPVYFGNGNGTFDAPTLLGDAVSLGVTAANLDGNNLTDIVFANVGAASRTYTGNNNGSFTLRDRLNIGDATSVAAGDLNNDGRDDLVFGRLPETVGDIPSNPVLINNGNGTFGNPSELLGISPTNDVLIGDLNEDGSPDIVFINASGVHQVWNSAGGMYLLRAQQIIDLGARTGLLAPLGDTDNGNPGGPDLAIGGGSSAGAGVYLNDSGGNLGRGDPVPPVLTLLGGASVDVPARTNYVDSGATAADNIDGDISSSIVVTNPVNTDIVGSYTVTYNVQDFAGNAAAPITRNVNVTPASGRGGGGGGALSYWMIVLLLAGGLLALKQERKQ